MKERPILFSGAMVRAILDGRKTQTRRVAKEFAGRDDLDLILRRFPHQNGCPYGAPGDRLWVREAWQYYDWSEDGEPCIRYAADNAVAWPQIPAERDAQRLIDIWAGLSAPENVAIDGWARDRRWRPSIHMPRWASRITLEIESVRVERLQDISEADAEAEGVRNSLHLQGGRFARDNFAHLWWTINGDGSWEANPFVWCVSFRKLAT